VARDVNLTYQLLRLLSCCGKLAVMQREVLSCSGKLAVMQKGSRVTDEFD